MSSVYETRGRFNFDFNLNMPEFSSPFISTAAVMSEYSGATYSIDFGDNNPITRTSAAVVPYMFRSVGTLKVKPLCGSKETNSLDRFFNSV